MGFKKVNISARIGWLPKRGDTIEGTYCGHRYVEGQYGGYCKHRVLEGQTMWLVSGTVLDDLFEGVQVGDLVRVVYNGRLVPGKYGNDFKSYDLYKWCQ